MITNKIFNLPYQINRVILPLESNYAQFGDLLVTIGQVVKKNQGLTRSNINSNSFVTLHAPISGIISKIDYLPTLSSLGTLDKLTKVLSIEISKVTESNDFINKDNIKPNINILNPTDLLNIINQSGIIGLGGAGFPTSQKLANKNIEILIINAMECEPPISVDNNLIINYSSNIISGIEILNKILKPKKIVIAIKESYLDAINILRSVINIKQSDILIQTFPSNYPNGYSKSLIKLVTNKELGENKHGSDYGVICLNPATVYAIEQAVNYNQPLTDRLVTISGDLIHTPGNYILPIGTCIKNIIDAFNIDINSSFNIRIGGEYMGYELFNSNNKAHLDNIDYLNSISIEKTTQAISINNNQNKFIKKYSPCIKCGYCEDICPMSLLPQQLYWFGQNVSQDKNLDILNDYNLNSCIECGLCDTVCPSNIPLTSIFKNLKTEVKYNYYKNNNAKLAKLRSDFKEKRNNDNNKKAANDNNIDKKSLLASALRLAKNKSLQK